MKKTRDNHGKSNTPEYYVWKSMLSRCNNQNSASWEYYGGRGISVCKEWREGFRNFWEDMGPSFLPGLKLDRKDNDGGYCKDNCRWVTHQENCNNRRSSHFIDTLQGVMSVVDASRVARVSKTTILNRISRGWPRDLLLAPPGAAYGKKLLPPLHLRKVWPKKKKRAPAPDNHGR